MSESAAGSRYTPPAMEAAGLVGDSRGRLRFHDLRHTFASILVVQGRDVVFIFRQMGHASTSITLDLYSHLFDRAKHAQRMRDALEEAFGGMVEAAFSIGDAAEGAVVELRP